MKKRAVIFALFIVLAAASAFKRNFDNFRVPDSWPKPAYNFKKHPLSAEKIKLGRILFYDPILSADSTISCASCHAPNNAFTHVDHNLSHGIKGLMGNRNSPVLVNLAWNRNFMWDGSVTHLNEQAKKPITNPVEMAETMDHVVAKLNRSKKYDTLFAAAFGPGAMNEQDVMEALSQFMLTLVSANAKYDRVMNGTEQFTASEARGYQLFKQDCNSCHTEPLFTNGGFENNGLTPDDSLRDIGRMKITGERADSLKFKVPTLRNISYSGPYMHDGRFKTLQQVLNNYIRGLQHGPTLSPQLQKGLYLTIEQKADVLAFLSTLSDKDFISNPAFSYPKN
jgi:cytochrome c peroxidase